MIPILYPADSTTWWANNGLGGLPDAISCNVTEQRNTRGGYWLKMDYPITGLHFDLLAPERIIYAVPSMGNGPQPFRISRISRPINGVVHIEAPHISAALKTLVTSGIQTGTDVATMGRAFFAQARNIGQSTHFDFASNVVTPAAITLDHREPASMMDVLLGAEGSILDQAGGEFEFYEFDVVLHAQRGVDSGIEIRYGVNMSDLEAETDATNLVTAVLPYWKGSVAGSDTIILGSICTAANASAYAYVRCIPLDVSDQFQLEQDQLPTSSQITEKGQAFINSSSRNQLQMSIRVKYESITDAIGERRINLCDTVSVVYPELRVSSTSKVVETVYNTLTEHYDELTIGSIQQTIVDTIASLLRR